MPIRKVVRRQRESDHAVLAERVVGGGIEEPGVGLCRGCRSGANKAWRVDEALGEREGDPLWGELEAAVKRVGELTVENELLQ